MLVMGKKLTKEKRNVQQKHWGEKMLSSVGWDACATATQTTSTTTTTTDTRALMVAL